MQTHKWQWLILPNYKHTDITPLHFLLSPWISIDKIKCTAQRDGSIILMIPFLIDQFSSVQFSCSVVSNSLRPHELQHARPPCPSPTARVYPNPCPLSWWCHPAISSSVVPFSCPQSLPASQSFPMSQLFSWGQSTGVSALASFLPKKSQGWSPSEWTS